MAQLVSLDIKYSVDGKKYENKQNIKLPASWREVGHEAMYKIAPNLLKASAGDQKAKTTIVNALIENQIQGIDFKKSKIQLPEWAVGSLENEIEWMYSEPFGHTPFKSFHHKGTEYFMPASLFGNCVIGEFHHIDQSHYKYANSQNPKLLTKMLAILARPARPLSDDLNARKIDIREKLLPELIGQRTKEFEDVDQGLVFANFQYVRGSLKWLNNKYKIFEDPAAEEEPTERTGPDFSGFEKKNSRRWQSIMMRIARHQQISYWEVFYEKLHSSMIWLDEERIEAERIEAERERIKNKG